MSRAGREPAEDVKRRLIAACAEVGQEATGIFRLIGDVRLVMVNTPTFGLVAQVPVSGKWPETVSVRCGTPEDLYGPFLHGCLHVPFETLVEELRATLDEREKVIAARQLGIMGPYRFERSEWKACDEK